MTKRKTTCGDERPPDEGGFRKRRENPRSLEALFVRAEERPDDRDGERGLDADEADDDPHAARHRGAPGSEERRPDEVAQKTTISRTETGSERRFSDGESTVLPTSPARPEFQRAMIAAGSTAAGKRARIVPDVRQGVRRLRRDSPEKRAEVRARGLVDRHLRDGLDRDVGLREALLAALPEDEVRHERVRVEDLHARVPRRLERLLPEPLHVAEVRAVEAHDEGAAFRRLLLQRLGDELLHVRDGFLARGAALDRAGEAGAGFSDDVLGRDALLDEEPLVGPGFDRRLRREHDGRRAAASRRAPGESGRRRGRRSRRSRCRPSSRARCPGRRPRACCRRSGSGRADSAPPSPRERRRRRGSCRPRSSCRYSRRRRPAPRSRRRCAPTERCRSQAVAPRGRPRRRARRGPSP